MEEPYDGVVAVVWEEERLGGACLGGEDGGGGEGF